MPDSFSNMLFNYKTVIGTLPAYLLIGISFIALIMPKHEPYEIWAAIFSLLASTEFLSVSFCYLFTILAYEMRALNEKCMPELALATIGIIVAFIAFKTNPITIDRIMDWPKYWSARFSILMPLISVLSLGYTATFFKRHCK